MSDALTDRERAVLALESAWPGHSDDKERAIRDELEISPVRFYQLLDRLMDTERALVHDPLLVRRLRRRRDEDEWSRADRHGLSGTERPSARDAI